MDRLVNYYLLCTIRMGTKSHVVTALKGEDIEAVFTKKEVCLYLRRVGDHYMAREVVIGGNQGHELPLGRTGGSRRPIIVVD